MGEKRRSDLTYQFMLQSSAGAKCSPFFSRERERDREKQRQTERHGKTERQIDMLTGRQISFQHRL